MTTSDTCSHCPRSRQEHSAAEREGVVRHQFSKDGELKPLDPAATVGPQQKQAVPTPQRLPADPILRYVLIQQGIITSDMLTEAEKTLEATGMLRTDVRQT